MNLVLSDEQRLIRDGATQLFRERGGVSRLRALRDGKDAKTRAVWGEMAALGWLGMTVPERDGGVGLGLAEMCLVAEAAGRALAPEPLVGCAVAATDALVLGGDEAQRARWLPRLIQGEALGALAWDEPGRFRGDLARTSTEARPVDGGFILHGAKQNVVAGAEADLLIVSARVAGSAELDLWLVDPRAGGVARTSQQRIDSLPVARVTLDGVKVAAGDRLPRSGVLPEVLDRTTVALAAELLGTASAAFEMTLGYLKDRQQFGVAIGTFQALRHRAARMYIALELARSAVMAAARMADARTTDARELAQAASLAKARTSDLALLVADESVQMHGGIGMTDEHDIGLYFKRARVAAMTLGDGAFHRDRWARLGGY
jgi:alkylation response protein AidB-like acyl-CoA dehydrogenase